MILIGRGLNQRKTQLLSGFEGNLAAVMKAKWRHLYPYRTQKLSTSAATIVGQAPAKTAHCRMKDSTESFLFCCSNHLCVVSLTVLSLNVLSLRVISFNDALFRVESASMIPLNRGRLMMHFVYLSYIQPCRE